MLRQLINSLGLLHPVSKGYESFIKLEEPFGYKPLKKGTLILLPGKNADELHFVGKGMFVLYRHNWKGEEMILDFFWENTFIMLPVDFYDGTANQQYYIRAIEKSELLSISKSKMDKIYALFPEARIHADRIRSQISLRTIDHLLLLFLQKEERYREFIKEYPKIAPRLTEYYISGFLATCTKTLNRCKRELWGRKQTFVWLFAGHLYCFFA